jgi:metal-dependent amidase/aminoacylase/carboxypeptidase family protein
LLQLIPELCQFVVFTSIGGHGAFGVLRNGSGKTVLLRSELDALPILEETDLPYVSAKSMFDENGEQQLVMHACGHNIHMTCLLGAAEILHISKKHWSGRVIALFQPNEEYVGGAKL